MNDVEEEINRVYALINEVVGPVLKRMDPLLFDLTMALGDSQRLHYVGMNDILADVLRSWAKQLVNPFGMDAPSIVGRQILQVAFGDEVPAEFWRTELGQRIFEVDGFPDRGATQVEAAVIMDMTRQGINKALNDHRLKPDKTEPGRVDRGALVKYAAIRRRRLALDRETRAVVAGDLT